MIRRLESKYLITAERAATIMAAVRPICRPDPFADARGEYTIHSLYYDTPGRRFYQANQFKEGVRFKPRIRFYGTEPSEAVFLELKRKVGDVVLKDRRRVGVAELETVLNQAPGSIDSFVGSVVGWGAIPTMHVRYTRRALVSELDTYARVTVDSALRGWAAEGRANLTCREEEMLAIDSDEVRGRSPVVLELKCEELIPAWMEQLVWQFGLVRQGFSKYCRAIERWGLVP